MLKEQALSHNYLATVDNIDASGQVQTVCTSFDGAAIYGSTGSVVDTDSSGAFSFDAQCTTFAIYAETFSLRCRSLFNTGGRAHGERCGAELIVARVVLYFQNYALVRGEESYFAATFGVISALNQLLSFGIGQRVFCESAQSPTILVDIGSEVNLLVQLIAFSKVEVGLGLVVYFTACPLIFRAGMEFRKSALSLR